MIIILGIIVGLFLAFVCAPIVIAANRTKIKTMRGIVEQYEQAIANKRTHDPEFEGWNEMRRATRKRLLDIKRKIFPGDKKSVIEASDIMDDFDQIPVPGR
jgi:signal recognition particle receptor subunit beta